MSDVVDMKRFAEMRAKLKGSTTDTLIMMQVISIIDYMADMLMDQQDEIKRLRSHLSTLEKSLEDE